MESLILFQLDFCSLSFYFLFIREPLPSVTQILLLYLFEEIYFPACKHDCIKYIMCKAKV